MKNVVVTGASRGLGKNIAEAFLVSGWRVVGTGRSERPAELSQGIEYQQFDAADADACQNFWQNLQTDGEICLVNNAGGFTAGGILETQPDDYENQMRINYFTGVYMTRGLIAHAPAARIFNLISNSANSVSAKTGAYAASKVAAKQFFQSLQKELPTEKYRITNFYPTNIATAGNDPKAIAPKDLTDLIIELAESQNSYYPTDITLAAAPVD